jgi:hypothetical protein
VDGGMPVRLVDTPSHHPLWSPDGKFILYAEPLQGGTFVAKAISPDKAPVRLPELQVDYTTSTPYRFISKKALIVLHAEDVSLRNFNWFDLETGERRRLTDFNQGW